MLFFDISLRVYFFLPFQLSCHDSVNLTADEFACLASSLELRHHVRSIIRFFVVASVIWLISVELFNEPVPSALLNWHRCRL